jgi:multidrug efflux pump subunit AcrB
VNIGKLSIERPVLALVLSIFVLIIGALAYFGLPVSEYPEVAPPTVVVHASYPGASAQVASDTVATPIEQEVNGVEDMIYMYSQSTGDGQVNITITFKLGTDLDQAQVLVQTASPSRYRACLRRFSASASPPARTRRICCW